MSEVTILVPAPHAAAISESLAVRRGELLEELDALLAGQIAVPDPLRAAAECRTSIATVEAIRRAGDDASGPLTLTGARTELWRAVYDVLCTAASWLSDACNDYWDGATSPHEIRARIASVGTLFSVLERAGTPPGRPPPS